MKRLHWVLLIVALLMAGALAAVFFTQLERKKVTIKFGPAAEARANPRLAAMKLLERFKLKTRTLRDPAVLPGKGALVLLPSEVFLDASRIERWRQWVEEGGILMVGLGLDAAARDQLLAGVTRVEDFQEAKAKDGESGDSAEPGKAAEPGAPANAEDADGEEEEEEEAETADPETAPALDEIGAADSEDYYTFAPLVGTEPELRLAIHPRWVMNRADFDRCRSGYFLDEGGVVAIFQQGQGYLVVLADDTIFDNERIAGVDHALFLWHLVKYFEDPPEVAVLLGDRIGLAGYLWRYAWPFLVALALLTFFFVWERAPRFGPLAEARRVGQRGLRAHLQAAAAFLWRHHEQPALIEPLRAEVQRRARMAIPGWPGFTPEKRRAELARIARLPEPAIDAALLHSPGDDPREFVAMVATLETLRKAL